MTQAHTLALGECTARPGGFNPLRATLPCRLQPESPGRGATHAGDAYWTVALLLGALLLMANEVAPDLTMLGFTVVRCAEPQAQPQP